MKIDYTKGKLEVLYEKSNLVVFREISEVTCRNRREISNIQKNEIKSKRIFQILEEVIFNRDVNSDKKLVSKVKG